MASQTMTRSPSGSADPPGDAARDARGPDQVLDVRGLRCPLPVLKARKALKRMAPRQVLLVEATDAASVIDFRHFCETTPFELLDWSERDGVFAFYIRTPS